MEFSAIIFTSFLVRQPNTKYPMKRAENMIGIGHQHHEQWQPATL